MTISPLSSTDYSNHYSTTASAKSARANPLQKALETVESDLKSGDTSSASTVLNNILSHGPKSTTSSSSSTSSSDGTSTDPGDTINKYLKSIQSSLTSGDTTGAATALSSLQDFMTANQPPTPPNGDNRGVSGASSTQNPLQKALASVASDLKSGDTSSASTVLSDIISHSPKTADSTSSSSPASTFGKYLDSLSSAISSGDTTTAQSLVSSLQDYVSKNQPPAPPTNGLYSADGSFTSNTVSDSAISALA